MVTTLILICLSSVEPMACNSETALIRLHGPRAMVQQCAMAGETMLAAQPDPILGRRYAKIVCERQEAMR